MVAGCRIAGKGIPVRSTTRLATACLGASLALLAASAPAAAAPKKITGKLSRAALTVIALDKGGGAASKPAKANGKFKLRPPAKKVSLHLRAADGTYAGPVVIDKKGKRGRKAILGVEVGAELGKVKVRSDYAKLKRDLPREDVDRKRKAKARKGVPIGAGNFGRVAAAATGTPGPGQDLDRDGIPGALDVDDDGDLVLDNLDQTSAGRRAQPRQGCGPNGFYCQAIGSGFGDPFRLDGTVNVNAGSTPAEMDAKSVSTGVLRFAVGRLVPGLTAPAELDCAGDPQAEPPRPGLLYCSAGGSGEATLGGGPPGPPFPECCDLDGDGFGTLDPALNTCTSCTADFFLKHGAVPRRPGLDPTISQIGSGDLMIERIPSGDTEVEVPATVNYVFATTTALASFNDEVGPETNVVYPVAQGDPGTSGNGFPVDDGSDPDGDVELTLTFWRPQRHAIEDSDPPGAEWMDLGHLRYTAGVHLGSGAPGGGACPQSTLISADLSELAPPSLPLLNQASLEDLGDDQVSSPANTFTYTLNLSQCLAANGIESSFDEAGEELNALFTAIGGSGDGAGHGVAFVRP
jgi:hypothetical protein